MSDTEALLRNIRVLGPGVRSLIDHLEGNAPWVRVECPNCGKFFCRATPGSTVEVVCSRCKTESITTVAA